MTTDEQLVAVHARREQAVDRMIDALIEVCNCDYRLDVLLDRKTTEAAAEQPERMT